MWIRAGLILGLILLIILKWKDWSVIGVTIRRTCRDQAVFVGEESRLTFEIVNRKILPLPWIQWEMEWPEGLVERDQPKRDRLRVTSSLLPFQRLKRRVPVRAVKRGYHVLGETRVSIGDLFGAAKGSLVDASFDTLSVYPKVEALETLLPLAAFPQGQVSVRRWIQPDLYQPVGARDYYPGDPVNTMDWKSTARHGRLMVREFAFTAEPRLSILLNLGNDFRNMVKPQERERLIAFAASLGLHAIEEKIPLAFETNAFLRASDPCGEREPVWHGDRGRLILEKAARIADQVEVDFDRLLEERLATLTADTTLVVVAASLTPSVLSRIETMRMEGKAVQLALLNQAGTAKGDVRIPMEEVAGHGE